MAADTEEARPSEVMFVGFTDSVGSFEANEALSRGRSLTLRQTITQRLSDEVRNAIDISSIGYGELHPAARNEQNDGRRIDRRVEVWVR